MSALRLSRIAVVAAVAFFFTLVAFGNITDHQSNWAFVQRVMAMDTTFRSPNLMWRAITDEGLQRAAYLAIIAWQVLTALLLWIGTFRLLRSLFADRDAFAAARSTAILGLTAGFLLYGVVFLGVAGEWFAMWQSPDWNGQDSAAIFLTFIGIALLHLSGGEHPA